MVADSKSSVWERAGSTVGLPGGRRDVGDIGLTVKCNVAWKIGLSNDKFIVAWKSGAATLQI
jgi:hypothetical protein